MFSMSPIQEKTAEADIIWQQQNAVSELDYNLKAKIKAIIVSNPTHCLRIIMDAMESDQRKIKVPFHNNPQAPKEINSQDPLIMNTKVIALIVHGHGTFLYCMTDEITHDSNLSM